MGRREYYLWISLRFLVLFISLTVLNKLVLKKNIYINLKEIHTIKKKIAPIKL